MQIGILGSDLGTRLRRGLHSDLRVGFWAGEERFDRAGAIFLETEDGVDPALDMPME